jgi:hypothetical protein
MKVSRESSLHGPSWLAPTVVILGMLALSSLVRYRLVEPADLTALCAASPWDSPACLLRSLAVQAFSGQRIGIAALACALLALLSGRRSIALLALASASAGLILYSTDWAAPAVLLAALALLPPTSAR